MVYFLTDGEFIKIGYSATSRNAEKWADEAERCALYRKDQVQIGNPRPLQILGFIEGGLQHERVLHQYFQETRVRGEWFLRSQRLLDYIRLIGRKSFVHPNSLFESHESRMKRLMKFSRPEPQQLLLF